jgi:hypothetical protein
MNKATDYTHVRVLLPAVSLDGRIWTVGDVIKLADLGCSDGHLGVIKDAIDSSGNTYHVLEAGKLVRGKSKDPQSAFVRWEPPEQDAEQAED